MSTLLTNMDVLKMLTTIRRTMGTRAYHHFRATIPLKVAPGAMITPTRSPTGERGGSGSTGAAFAGSPTAAGAESAAVSFGVSFIWSLIIASK